MNTLDCPRCHTPVPQLQEVRPELQNFLLLHQSSDGLLKKVCSTCLQSFEDSVHDVNLIQNRTSGPELAKMQMWGKRTELIKEAWRAMKENKPDEALAKYDAYLRNIEQYLGTTAAAITAQNFHHHGKMEELPIYCLVLWDVITCNDGKNEASQKVAADKMLELIKGTALRKTLRVRAQQYQKKAKNKKFFKKLLKDFQKDRGCYVASFAYESEQHPQVLRLRQYRDEVLVRSIWGRCFIAAYYLFSPTLVKILRRISGAQNFSKWLIERLIKKL